MAATFPSYNIPSLAAGNRVSGSALVPRAQGSQSLETLTSQVFLNGLGANVTKLGPLISASKRTWGDIDLHTVNATNAMILSDTLQYKLNTTTGASFLTGVLAPKVLVPSNINTFKGRSYQYNIVPATIVPKRGTVRSMTKTLQEWQTTMRQSGIGSQIEGGAYRSPQGAIFLEQEMTAFGLSLEMNVCLSTAETAIMTAITRPFRDPTRSDVTEATLGLQISRELETFCCAGGDSSYFSNVISKMLSTIPSASLMLAPLSLTQSLRFNDVGAPMIFPNQTVSMINENGSNTLALTKNGTSSSLYTIFGGRLAVSEMPVFTFLENTAPYQPLEHAMVTTEFTVLGPDRGLVAWYEVQPTNLSGPQMQDYTSKNLSNFAFDHNHNARTEISFANALKHTYLFSLESKYNRYNTGAKDRKDSYDSKMRSYIDTLNTLINNQQATSDVNVKEISTIFSRYKSPSDATEYIEATTIKQNQLQKRDVNVIEDLQRLKRNLQFPVTSRLNADNHDYHTSSVLHNVCLPNCIGDLDPAHLSTNFFKCMVGDIQNTMYDTLACDGAALYKVLRSQILDSPLDENFFKALHIHNIQNNSPSSKILCGNKSAVLNMLTSMWPNIQQSSLFPSENWGVDSQTEFIHLPPEYLQKELKELSSSNKGAGFGISKEAIPQGVWSARGIRHLAQSSAIGVGNVASSAKMVLTYLTCIWKQLCSMLPYTIFSNYNTAEQEALILGLGTPASNDVKSGVISDIDGVQIVMNLLDSDVELYHLALAKERDVPLSEHDIVYGSNDITPLLYDYDTKFAASFKTSASGPVVTLQNEDTEVAITFSSTIPNIVATTLKIFKTLNTGDPDYVNKLLTAVRSDTAGYLESYDRAVAYAAGVFIHVTKQLLKKTRNMANKIENPWTYNNQAWGLVQGVKDVVLEMLLDKVKAGNAQLATVAENQKILTQKQTAFHSTGLVISAKQARLLSTTFPYLKAFTKFGIADNNWKNQLSSETSDTMKYRDLYNKMQKYGRVNYIFSEMQTNRLVDVCHTVWFEKRMQLLAATPLVSAETDWDPVLRMISAFLLHTQLNFNALNKMILSQIRPPFDIACWRSPCHLFHGVLLAEPGLSTMFNPYTNPHTGMGRDANTDQYMIRAVVETATVVINPNKLAFIGGVQPVAYCGGRNNKFVTDPSMIRTLNEQGVHQPSLLACAVSHGYMPTTVEEPLSFINRPPCAVTNGVPENMKETQRWPGAHYYGRLIYGQLFRFVAKNVQTVQGMTEEQQQRACMEWLLSNTTTGHIGFKMNVYVYDKNTGAYSYSIPGTGHLKSDAFNSTGAKDYFEGKSSTPINMRVQPSSNYM